MSRPRRKLIVDPVAYIDEVGFPRGQVTATWAAVTADVAGVALGIDGYELFARINQAGALWMQIAVTDETTAAFSPLVVGESYAFKVRATSAGVKGEFSEQIVKVIPDDVTPPPVPSAPQVSTRLGVIHVGWDGLGVGGEVMPSDFLVVRVWMQDRLPLARSWWGIWTSLGRWWCLASRTARTGSSGSRASTGRGMSRRHRHVSSLRRSRSWTRT